MALNLHDVVRGVINSNHPDQPFVLFRSIGQKNVNGTMTALYSAGEELMGNLQSEGDSALYHAEKAGKNSTIRRLYLYAPDNLSQRPWAIFRPLSRSGDYIADKFGNYWLVTAVLEDFTQDGWISLRVTLQTTPVNLTIEGSDGN